MKSEQLQVRLTSHQKEELRRRAAAAGQDLSQYVLSRILPEGSARWDAALKRLAAGGEARLGLAGLHDILAGLAPQELEMLPTAGIESLDVVMRCRVAAMLEQACSRASVAAPAWAAGIPPLEAPDFAAPLRSLRLHLLKASPVAFRRRNLFVDSTVGDRV